MSIIETERLILRHFCENDFDAVFNIYSNGLACEISKSEPDIYTKAVNDMFSKWLNEYKEGLDIRWAITLKGCSTIVGDIIINKIIMVDNVEEAEIGYNIIKKYWNNGYATEAAKAVIQNLFDRGVARVIAYHELDNPASGRVMEKCGMKFAGNENRNVFNDTNWEISKYIIEKSS